MKLISHRGNLNGPNKEHENHPDYIWEALQAGYEVEIDVWWVDGKFKLGHDEPQYDFPFELIETHYFVTAKLGMLLFHWPQSEI